VTIADAIAALDQVVARASATGSRIGYFAAMYRKVTAKVADGIAEGFFDDGSRMERFDVVFANRYLDALAAFERGEAPTRSWAVAFRAADTRRPIILQHLLVGINAHINLDLGIAAATTAPGRALPGLRRDFDRINEILAVLMANVASDLGAASPWTGLLDRIGGRHDDELIRFSLTAARADAWRFAVELAPLAVDHWPGPIGARDRRVAGLARRVLNPGWLSAGLALIRAREGNDVRHNIAVLSRVPGPDLRLVDSLVRRDRAG
jgi:hypothetical protein